MEKANKKIRWTKKLHHAFSEVFTEYRVHSSIHGLRATWAVCFSVALCCCTLMVMHTLYEFHDNPTMHRLEAYHSLYSHFPFPAVTICNVNRFQKSRARHFVDLLKMPTSSDTNRSTVYNAIPHLAALSSADISEINFDMETATMLQDVLDYNNVTIREAFAQMNQPCSELFERCRWDDGLRGCLEFFEWRLTYQGYCCSFNYVLNRRYRPKRRGTSFGAGAGLTLLLNLASHDVLPGTAVALGAKLILHENTDFPDTGIERVRCGVGKEWLINLWSSESLNGNSLRSLSTNQRQCLFEDEVQPLNGYLPYSLQNCHMICRMKSFQKLCGCVSFYIPRAIARGHRICNLRDLPCISKNQVELETTWNCGCFPTCISVRFRNHIHSGDLKASEFHTHDTFYDDVNLTDRTVLHIYFGEQLTARTRTSIAYSLCSFMAISGGYCNLFLGCSLLSGLEIVHFFIIRLLRRLQPKTALKDKRMFMLKRTFPFEMNVAVNEMQ